MQTIQIQEFKSVSDQKIYLEHIESLKQHLNSMLEVSEQTLAENLIQETDILLKQAKDNSKTYWGKYEIFENLAKIWLNHWNHYRNRPEAIDLMKSIDSQASLISLNASGKHYYILDEIDNLTNAAQASLKAAMNLPTSIFIMTTNHVEQVEKGVKNRSIMIDMKAASVEQWLPIMKALLLKANIKDADDQMLADLIEPCHGSVRDIMDAVTTIISRRSKMIV
jgi:hypothetical protein